MMAEWLAGLVGTAFLGGLSYVGKVVVGRAGEITEKIADHDRRLDLHEERITSDGGKLDHIVTRVDALYDHLLESRRSS